MQNNAPQNSATSASNPNAATPPSGSAESPTKFRRHELKLVLNSEDATLVQQWANMHLSADRFSPGGRPYLVHSLYFDTPRFDIFHRSWEEGGTKYRIRRYGAESVLWLERKRSEGLLVRKRRGRWAMDRLTDITGGGRSLEGWPKDFRAKVRDSLLTPRLLISYPRSAWSLGNDNRLTLDWGVEARIPEPGSPFALSSTPVRVSDEIILELKYDNARPPEFDALLTLLARKGGTFSKYGRGVEITGCAQHA